LATNVAGCCGKTEDQVDGISQALAYESSGYDTTMRWVSDGYPVVENIAH
jgi:hypothetical protein